LTATRRFSAGGKHRHRLKHAGSGKRRREEEARQFGRDRGDGASARGGGGGSPGGASAGIFGAASGVGLWGWRPLLFLGLLPLAAWLATVYVKPDLRRELIHAVASGPRRGDDDDEQPKPAESNSA
jgi:hypothetical protein